MRPQEAKPIIANIRLSSEDNSLGSKREQIKQAQDTSTNEDPHTILFIFKSYK